jgi:hypothetical protein
MNAPMEFSSLCWGGRLEEARGLVLTHPTLDIHARRDEAFRWACGSGRLEVAQWLCGLDGVDIHVFGTKAFRSLELAEWLWGLGRVDIHAVDDYAFRWSWLEVVRWLLSADPAPCVNVDVRDVVRLRIWSRVRVAWCSWVS